MLAFCAFAEDSDDHIDYDDVMSGAFKKDGTFQQLGQKYFSDLYFDQIGSDEYRGVLRAMADHADDWVTKQTLKSATRLKPGTLDNAIRALKKRGIIIPRPGQNGVYRLPTRSFAVWIKAFTADRNATRCPDRSVDQKGSTHTSSRTSFNNIGSRFGSTIVMSQSQETHCYLLVHDTTAATHDRMKTILNSIARVETWRTDISNCFYVVSKESAVKLSELIRSRTGNQGRYLISEIPENNRQGWLTPESWYVINNKRLKSHKT